MPKRRKLLSSIQSAVASVAQSHPYIWKFSWDALHRLPFLLPHDKSYNAFRHFIKSSPAGLFLDVGANDGISVLSFRKFDRDYRILSLEPNPLLEPALKKIKERDSRFEYRMVGAGDRPARLKLYVPSYRGVVLHILAAVEREQVVTALANCFGRSVAKRCTIDPVEGEIIRIDDLKVEPSIVKIDAEGFDYQVLLGAGETIAHSRPFVMVEIAFAAKHNITDFFAQRDYLLAAYDIDQDRFTETVGEFGWGPSGERNIFGIPKEKMAALPFQTG
jgi:FkbM family methyltransferase